MTYAIPGASHQTVEVDDGVTLSVHQIDAEGEAGDRPAVVFSHGFPDLAFAWRSQLAAVAGAGFDAIAPDQRGYGGSSRPDAITDYDIHHLTGDLVGILDRLDIERAVFVGHDWGGFVVWQMPLLHPDRVAGVVGVNTPYIPRLPIPPTEAFRMVGGDGMYILEFQEPGKADEILLRDVPGLFDALFRTAVSPDEMALAAAATPVGPDAPTTFERIVAAPRMGEPMLDAQDMAVYVDTFTETGFTGGLNWYRNFDRNWETTPQLDGAHIDGLPCLMVTAAWDPVLTPALAQGMPSMVGDLEMHEMAECGHWTPTERADDLSALLVDWLTRRF
jgi:pimeloyl-ACP methyl ester carboxylesterase